MGLFRSLGVNEGVYFHLGAQRVDLILRLKGGTRTNREVVFEVSGVPGLNHLYMTSSDRPREIVDGFRMSICSNPFRSTIEMYFDTSKHIITRKYD